MARTRLSIAGNFTFSCEIPVRITDINYGGHVGNDTVLTIIHEARMQFLRQFQYTEMDLEGIGMIMAEATIQFKSELFYGDIVRVSVMTGEISRSGFELLYRLEKPQQGKMVMVAIAKTGMVCFDYKRKKIVSLPEEAKRRLTANS